MLSEGGGDSYIIIIILQQTLKFKEDLLFKMVLWILFTVNIFFFALYITML